MAVGLLMLCAVGHVFLLGSGLVPFKTGEWGFSDYSYLAMMALMSVALIAHSGLSEDVLKARTIIVLSGTFGGVGTLVALVKGWLLLFGAAFAEEDWVIFSVFGTTALSILPFVLPLTAGVILSRSDIAPRAWRMRAIAVAIALSATMILIAAVVPRLVRLV